MKSATLPPGPSGRPLTGVLRDLRRDQLGLFTRAAREYGDIVTLRIGPLRWFLLSRPDLLEQVLVTHQRDFIRPLLLRQSRVTFGDSLLVSSGPTWLQRRRLAQPAFHRERIAEYGEEMVGATQRMLATWRDGDRRDVHDEMMRLTLAIAGRTLFGVDVHGDAPEVGAALDDLMHAFTARMNSAIPLPDTVPTPANLRNRRAVGRLHALIDRYIDRARSGQDRESLLAMLVHARDEDGSRMTDLQLRQEALTLFLAGHETTALALTWTFFLLSRHPQAAERLQREVDDVLGGRPPTTADAARLPYTDRVLREALRLYPPAYAFARDSVGECELDGYRLPAKSTVVLAPWVSHRDPRYFPRPGAFGPDRWDGDLHKRLPRFAYFPFGGGPHLCIGASFAMLEATLVLATVAQRFRLALAPGHQVGLEPLITLRPLGGMPMTLSQRRPAVPVTAADAGGRRGVHADEADA